jgi:DNA-binding NarL/FixJ family response regulator
MIDLAIIEDSDTYRQALETLVRTRPDINLVYSGPSLREALPRLKEYPPHVAILDIELGEESGIDGVKKIHEVAPETGIFMLTVFEDTEKIMASIQAGALGYLLKKDSPDKILEAIQTVYKGEGIVNASMTRKLFDHFSEADNRPKLDAYKLTKRETEITKLLMEGLSYKEIAGRLFISVDTLNSHIRNIYTKLDVHSKSELIAKFR